MESVICLYTATYPYGLAETFLENEIRYLSKEFDEVYIFPHNASSNSCRAIPANAKVIKIHGSQQPYKSYKSKQELLKNLFSTLKSLIIEFIGNQRKAFFIKNIRKWLTISSKGVYDGKRVLQIIGSNKLKKGVHYSAWNNEWALALAHLREKKIINNFIIRSGGYDIYNERHPGNYLPFRKFVYKKADAIYPNSIMGTNYIKDLEIYPEKIHCAYLGTEDNGLNPFNSNETIRVVSVSNIIPLKRVNLIIELLTRLNKKIEWIHFGDGIERSKIEQLAESKKSEKFSYYLMGRMKNSEVLDYYRNNSIDYFITTSETEGLPISIQEAISFGIPIISTNVGGIKEVVNENFGVLLNRDFNLEDGVFVIEEFMKRPMDVMRTNARSHWDNMFNSNKVYSQFATNLKKNIQLDS